MDAFLKGSKSKPSGSKDHAIQSKESLVSSSKRQPPTPWVEKYRPKTVKDVASQEEVVAVLKKTLKGGDLSNLLFYGPPGTGKTSTILALAREMFGDLYKSRILELNASDERGIKVIREKVKTFAQQTVSSTRPDGQQCPAFKIIILDEADSMTNSAQAALRRTMEKETKSTRFCLICNYVSRIIEPLTSRCSKFRFKPLGKEVLIEHLKGIANAEGVVYDDGVLDILVETSEGDLRKAITLLQSAYQLTGEDKITADDICEVAGVIPSKLIDDLVKVSKTNSYEKLESFVNNIVYEGYSAYQVINHLHDYIIASTELTDIQKSAICERLAICDHRLMEGADEFLQMMDFCTVMMHQICHSV